MSLQIVSLSYKIDLDLSQIWMKSKQSTTYSKETLDTIEHLESLLRKK